MPDRRPARRSTGKAAIASPAGSTVFMQCIVVILRQILVRRRIAALPQVPERARSAVDQIRLSPSDASAKYALGNLIERSFKTQYRGGCHARMLRHRNRPEFRCHWKRCAVDWLFNECSPPILASRDHRRRDRGRGQPAPPADRSDHRDPRRGRFRAYDAGAEIGRRAGVSPGLVAHYFERQGRAARGDVAASCAALGRCRGAPAAARRGLRASACRR